MWEQWIREYGHYLKLERSLSHNSVDGYVRDVKKLYQFVGLRDSNLSPLHVTPSLLRDFLEYINELGLGAQSQARILSGLKGFYKFLIFDGAISQDPTKLIEAPRLGRKLPDTLSFHEIEIILDAIDLSTPEGARNRAMLEVLYSSGLRVSELVDLQINNIYRDSGFLKVTGKGNKERLVPVGRDARKYLFLYLDDVRGRDPHKPPRKGFESYVFLNRYGSKLTRVMVFTIIRNIARQIGLKKKISPHTFRHSFATHLIEGGADLRAVQEMLGHESVTTTEIYTHLDRDYLRQVVQEFHPRS